jgi:hypothetical protein
MAQSDVTVSFNADVSGLKAGANEAGSTFSNCLSNMQNQFAPLTRAWEKSLSGMLSGSMNFYKARQTLEQGALKAAEDAGAKMLSTYTANEAKKAMIAASSQSQLQAIRSAGEAETLAGQAALAMKSIANSAAEAFAGATAFLAPVLGPAAPAGAAAVSGAVLAEGASIMSAAGGFDIPAGLNPITQLHQNEMVLPAELADKVRGMTAQNAPMTVHIHAMDGLSFKSFIDRNGSYLVDSLNRQMRQFNYGKSA